MKVLGFGLLVKILCTKKEVGWRHTRLINYQCEQQILTELGIFVARDILLTDVLLFFFFLNRIMEDRSIWKRPQEVIFAITLSPGRTDLYFRFETGLSVSIMSVAFVVVYLFAFPERDLHQMFWWFIFSNSSKAYSNRHCHQSLQVHFVILSFRTHKWGPTKAHL